MVINVAFDIQSSHDIHGKIKGIEVFGGKNRSELLAIFHKVFSIRKSKEDLFTKKMGKDTMAILQKPSYFQLCLFTQQ